jgi:uncharacterized protein (DUF983 family)
VLGPYWTHVTIMTEGYCDKCKATREMLNPVEEQLKNGRRSIRGRCPECGTGLLKMIILGSVDEPDQSFAPIAP